MVVIKDSNLAVMIKECPSVAVLLAAYNGMKWIEEQIVSIFNQQGVNVKIFISVDVSDDRTNEWSQNLAKKNRRVRVLSYGNRFGGASKNFFRLINDVDFSDFQYVAFADQDDIWLPNKLIHAVGTIKSMKICAFSSDVVAFYQDGSELLIKKSYRKKKFDHFFESGGPGCTYVFESSALEQFKDFLILNLDKANSIMFHDWLIYAYFREHGLSWHIDSKPLMKYRRHDSNVIGPNSGFEAFITRLSMVKSIWYRKEVESIYALIGAENRSELQLDRLYLIKNFWQLRRRPKEAIALLLLLISGAY